MASSQQTTKPPSIFKILHEAIKLPTKKLNLLPILLLSFITFISIPIVPIDSKSPDITILIFTTILFLVFFIASYIVTIPTINALSLSLSDSPSTISDSLFKPRGGLKGPMITTLYVVIFSQGFFYLLDFLFNIFMYIVDDSMSYDHLQCIPISLDLVYDMSTGMIFAVGLVISVVEDQCYGLNAISKATEVLRWRKWQGAMFVLIEVVIVKVVDLISSMAMFSAPVNFGLIWLVSAVFFVVEEVFAWAVSLVFYFEFKRINSEERMGIVDDDGLMYESVPDAPSQDEEEFP